MTSGNVFCVVVRAIHQSRGNLYSVTKIARQTYSLYSAHVTTAELSWRVRISDLIVRKKITAKWTFARFQFYNALGDIMSFITYLSDQSRGTSVRCVSELSCTEMTEQTCQLTLGVSHAPNIVDLTSWQGICLQLCDNDYSCCFEMTGMIFENCNLLKFFWCTLPVTIKGGASIEPFREPFKRFCCGHSSTGPHTNRQSKILGRGSPGTVTPAGGQLGYCQLCQLMALSWLAASWGKDSTLLSMLPKGANIRGNLEKRKYMRSIKKSVTPC